MKSNSKKAIIAFSVFIAIILFIMIINVIVNKIENANSIPTLKISLKDITLNEINNNSKKIKYKDNKIEITANNKKINDTITIKGRGNSTWNYPKKPYQIEFSNEVNLLGLGKSKKFVLLANYIDETLLRNDIAFYMANKLNMPYVLRGKNVNLYIDDEYQGVYYLTNKVEISEGSLNLKNDNAILVELDNIYFYQEDYYVSNKYKDHLVIKDVKDKSLKQESILSFINKYNKLEEAVTNHNWDEIISLIDIDSLAKHHIIYELTRNGDAYRSSFFMYMDGNDDKIHFGPVWDFDMAFSNNNSKINEANSKLPDGYNESVIDDTYNKYSQVFYMLTNFDEFKRVIKDNWNEYMTNALYDIEKEIDNNYYLLNDVANKNIRKWDYEKKYSEYIVTFKEDIESIYNSFSSFVANKY